MDKRNYYIDNIKALLIILVVIGHLLELFLNNDNMKFIYILIYSFHMPLFIFCSGYFSKKDNEVTLRKLLYLFIFFQVLYLIFSKYILKNSTIVFTFTTPYWILWYLVSLVFWNIIIQFINEINVKTIVAAFMIGLIAGLDESIGYFFSLSRTIVFLPFFLLGYYSKNHNIYMEYIRNNKLIKCFLISLIIVFLAFIYINLSKIDIKLFYGSYSYDKLKYNMFIRLVIYVFAIVNSAIVIAFTPKVFIKHFTDIGSDSLSIYLFHGFIIKLMSEYLTMSKNITDLTTFLFIVLSAIIIVELLRLKYFKLIIKKISRV